MEDLVVLKFGGAAVATPERFEEIARIILIRRAAHARCLVVVSAMGDMTDQLEELARRVHPDPPKRELDMLVSVGERISISLLAMALARLGHQAVSFTGSQSGIVTSDDHAEARIVDVRPARLKQHLDAGHVVIVAGFQGVSAAKEITTLGRGGSDTTAVALGVALGAKWVEFFKDVKGIHSQDPRQYAEAPIFPRLTYVDALQLVHSSDHAVLHPRAISLAAQHCLPLHVWCFACPEQGPGTVIEGGDIQEKTLTSYEREASSC